MKAVQMTLEEDLWRGGPSCPQAEDDAIRLLPATHFAMLWRNTA